MRRFRTKGATQTRRGLEREWKKETKERGGGGRERGSLEMKKTLVSREHNVCRLSDFAFATHAFNAESPRASIVRATLE